MALAVLGATGREPKDEWKMLSIPTPVLVIWPPSFHIRPPVNSTEQWVRT